MAERPILVAMWEWASALWLWLWLSPSTAPTLRLCLADLVCPDGHGDVCMPAHFDYFGLESLQPCIDRLPTAEKPEMAEFMGY